MGLKYHIGTVKVDCDFIATVWIIIIKKWPKSCQKRKKGLQFLVAE